MSTIPALDTYWALLLIPHPSHSAVLRPYITSDPAALAAYPDAPLFPTEAEARAALLALAPTHCAPYSPSYAPSPAHYTRGTWFGQEPITPLLPHEHLLSWLPSTWEDLPPLDADKICYVVATNELPPKFSHGARLQGRTFSAYFDDSRRLLTITPVACKPTKPKAPKPRKQDLLRPFTGDDCDRLLAYHLHPLFPHAWWTLTLSAPFYGPRRLHPFPLSYYGSISLPASLGRSAFNHSYPYGDHRTTHPIRQLSAGPHIVDIRPPLTSNFLEHKTVLKALESTYPALAPAPQLPPYLPLSTFDDHLDMWESVLKEILRVILPYHLLDWDFADDGLHLRPPSFRFLHDQNNNPLPNPLSRPLLRWHRQNPASLLLLLRLLLTLSPSHLPDISCSYFVGRTNEHSTRHWERQLNCCREKIGRIHRMVRTIHHIFTNHNSSRTFSFIQSRPIPGLPSFDTLVRTSVGTLYDDYQSERFPPGPHPVQHEPCDPAPDGGLDADHAE